MSESRFDDFSKINPLKKDDVIGFVRTQWSSRDQRRSSVERQWYTNVLYYLGFQYHEWSSSARELKVPHCPPWRVRLVANRLMPIVRTNVGRFLRRRPTWEVTPATPDEQDVMASRVSDKRLRYKWREQEMDAQLVDLFTWTGITGNALLSITWDPDAGPQYGADAGYASGIPEGPEANGNRLLSGMNRLAGILGIKEKDVPQNLYGHLGETAYRVHSPFEIDQDPAATRLKEARYLIESRIVSPAYVADRYGKKAAEASMDDDSLSGYYLDNIASMSGPQTGAFNPGTRKRENLLIEQTLWCAPSKDLPEGQYICVVGQKEVSRGKLLTPGLPFAHFIEIPVPGRFWGTCAMEQAIPLQQDYNRGRSQTVENRNSMSRPKWMVPRGAGILDTALTDEPGEIVEFNWPMRPERDKPQELPSYVQQSLDQTLMDIQDVSAQREVSQARVPSGVRSGVAIAQLQEEDDSALAPAVLLAELGLSKIASYELRIASKMIKQDRLLRIAGEGSEVEVMVFSGQSILGANDRRPGVDYFDVTVKIGSQLPHSKAARLEFLKELAQYGIINVADTRERSLLLRMLEIGSDEAFIAESNLDRNAAMRENALMVSGAELPDIWPWEEDAEHIHHHRQFQKRPEYARLMRQDPGIVDRFERHIALHTARAAALQGIQLGAPMDQQMPQGGEMPLEDPLAGAPVEEGLPPEEGSFDEQIAMQLASEGF